MNTPSNKPELAPIGHLCGEVRDMGNWLITSHLVEIRNLAKSHGFDLSDELIHNGTASELPEGLPHFIVEIMVGFRMLLKAFQDHQKRLGFLQTQVSEDCSSSG